MSTINVTGKGSIHVVPDITRLEVVIESLFQSYEDAYSHAKNNSEWVGKILEYNELSAKLAKTIKFNISDHLENEYDDNENYIGKFKNGFELTQKFKIDLGIDNTLLNKIVKGIGKFIPDAQIDIGYTVKDPRPNQLKMLQRAVTDAKDKAELMAEAAGCKLGKVQEISYNYSDIHIYSQARSIHSNNEAITSTPSSLDITPDDLVVSDNVIVKWELIENLTTN